MKKPMQNRSGKNCHSNQFHQPAVQGVEACEHLPAIGQDGRNLTHSAHEHGGVHERINQCHVLRNAIAGHPNEQRGENESD